jgi:hypothetical protein
MLSKMSYDSNEGQVAYKDLEHMEYERTRTVEEIATEAGVSGDALVLKFYIYVNATAHRLIDEKVITNVKRNEIERILSFIKYVDNPQYKHPETFVLGYAVTKSGIIDGKMLNSIKLDDNIKPMDVLKYGHLWLNILKGVRK